MTWNLTPEECIQFNKEDFLEVYEKITISITSQIKTQPPINTISLKIVSLKGHTDGSIGVLYNNYFSDRENVKE